MGRRKQEARESEEPSRAAGACVLVVLAGLVDAIAWAVDESAGVLLVVVVGAVALWRSARRMSDSSATPPPEEWHPSCRKCAGQKPVNITPSESQKGMLIYSYALPKRPGHTHIHLAGEVNSE